MLKSVVFLGLFAVAFSGAVSLSSADEGGPLNDLKEKCAMELQLSPEDTAKIKAGEFQDTSPNAKCINKCLMEKSGMLVNGEYNVANIQKSFPNAGSPEQVAAKIDQCKTFNGEQCENVAKCAELLHKQ